MANTLLLQEEADEPVAFDLEAYSLQVLQKAHDIYLKTGSVGDDLRYWLCAQEGGL